MSENQENLQPDAGVVLPDDSGENFTTGTVIVALASQRYEEEDYIRDYDDYCRYSAEQFGI